MTNISQGMQASRATVLRAKPCPAYVFAGYAGYAGLRAGAHVNALLRC